MWIHACKWTLFSDWIQNSWGNCLLTSWVCTIGIWSTLTQLNLIRQIYALCYKSYQKLVHMEIYYELLNFPHREKFPGEKVPTLEEVVELCSSLGLKMIIEIKKGTETLEVRKIIREAICIFLYFYEVIIFQTPFLLQYFQNVYEKQITCGLIDLVPSSWFSMVLPKLQPSLTLYTPTSVCIFSLLFFIHFLRCWQGEFVLQSRASFCWWWFPIFSWP